MVLTANMEKVVKHAVGYQAYGKLIKNSNKQCCTKQAGIGNWPVAACYFWLWHHLIAVGPWHMYLCSYACTLQINCNTCSWSIMPAITNHWKVPRVHVFSNKPTEMHKFKGAWGSGHAGYGFPQLKIYTRSFRLGSYQKQFQRSWGTYPRPPSITVRF